MEGPQGWSSVFGEGNVPASCCHINADNSPNALCRNTDDAKVVYQQGCFDKLKMKIKDNIVIIMGVGIGIAFVEVCNILIYIM